ncbi:hypothetical protein [Companilactobacillus ginsenosidimutans]|uniref:Uncharacterized protein n=1 Tax=Companilactobacillus ginsenosidimutans TaxID=1007676 RepID=A0A0H4R1X3_9LACO|nr:hypothetical protein [Companilactobacillus ginsenosidimutans]AKP67735.1 hypothetical protein ABM34_09480 [Companilactobacillus ginsenosidimutans]
MFLFTKDRRAVYQVGDNIKNTRFASSRIIYDGIIFPLVSVVATICEFIALIAMTVIYISAISNWTIFILLIIILIGDLTMVLGWYYLLQILKKIEEGIHSRSITLKEWLVDFGVLLKKYSIWILIVIVALLTLIIVHHNNLVSNQNAFYYEYKKNPTNYKKINAALFKSAKFIPNKKLFKKSGINYDYDWHAESSKIVIEGKNLDVYSEDSGEIYGLNQSNGQPTETDNYFSDSFNFSKSSKKERETKRRTENLYFKTMKKLYDNWKLYK